MPHFTTDQLQGLLKQARDMRKVADVSLETAETEASQLVQDETNVQNVNEGSHGRQVARDLRENIPNSVEDSGGETPKDIPDAANEEKYESGDGTPATTDTFKDPAATEASELKIGKSAASQWLAGISKTAEAGNQLLSEIAVAIDIFSKEASGAPALEEEEESLQTDDAAIENVVKEAAFNVALSAVHRGSIVGEETALYLTKIAEELQEAISEENPEEGGASEEELPPMDDEADSGDSGDVPITDVGGENFAMDALGTGEDESPEDAEAEAALGGDGDNNADDNGGDQEQDAIEQLVQLCEESPEAAEVVEEILDMVENGDIKPEDLQQQDGADSADSGIDDAELAAMLASSSDTGDAMGESKTASQKLASRIVGRQRKKRAQARVKQLKKNPKAFKLADKFAEYLLEQLQRGK